MSYPQRLVVFCGGDTTGCQVNITLNAIRLHIFQHNNNNGYSDMLFAVIHVLQYCTWTMRNLSKHEQKGNNAEH